MHLTVNCLMKCHELYILLFCMFFMALDDFLFFVSCLSAMGPLLFSGHVPWGEHFFPSLTAMGRQHFFSLDFQLHRPHGTDKYCLVPYPKQGTDKGAWYER